MINEGALVLFSGGQDSTTCLAWALENFSHVETVGFDYGQLHRIELDCRGKILWHLNRGGHDHVLSMPTITQIEAIEPNRHAADSGFAPSFVPGRNLMFLTFAAAVAYRRGLRHIIGGMCETDYSGYPDCRDDSTKAMQLALNTGMASNFVLHTPLMWLNKADTWRLAERIGGEPLIDLIRSETHTCYAGDRFELHEWGYGCSVCPACLLRASGYNGYMGICHDHLIAS